MEKDFFLNNFFKKKGGGGKFEIFPVNMCKATGQVWCDISGIGSGDVGGEWEREGVVGTSREIKITS